MVVMSVLVILSVVSFVGWYLRKGSSAPQVPTVVEAKEGWKKEVRSGDGKIKVVGTNKEMADNKVEYVFRVLDAGKEVFVFRKVVDSEAGMDIPFNSWSPDNKQFFILENDGSGINYLVFKADGATYTTDRSFLDIAEYWNKSKNDYEIKTITGWAGNDLLEVKTIKTDGSNGPSFWFVTSTKGFLRLRG